MKKKLLLLLTPFIIGSAFAQTPITLYFNDVADIGKVIKQATDSSGLITPGTSGVNQTWNFSTLSLTNEDSIVFTNPNWTPKGSDFPSANLAMLSAGNVSYINKSSTELSFIGFADATLSLEFNPAEKMLSFPSTYNTAFTNTSELTGEFATGDPTVDSVRIKNTTVKNSLVDGWGTVITPLGSFESLRVKDIKEHTDSSWIHFMGSWMFYQETISTDYTYTWWAKSIGFSIVEMDSTDAGVESVRWLMSIPTATGINESVGSKNVLVYPNPATDVINFSLKENAASDIIVTDIAGKVISIVKAESLNTSLNTANLSNGVYFYNIKGKSNETIASGKFHVIK